MAGGSGSNGFRSRTYGGAASWHLDGEEKMGNYHIVTNESKTNMN